MTKLTNKKYCEKVLSACLVMMQYSLHSLDKNYKGQPQHLDLKYNDNKNNVKHLNCQMIIKRFCERYRIRHPHSTPPIPISPPIPPHTTDMIIECDTKSNTDDTKSNTNSKSNNQNWAAHVHTKFDKRACTGIHLQFSIILANTT